MSVVLRRGQRKLGYSAGRASQAALATGYTCRALEAVCSVFVPCGGSGEVPWGQRVTPASILSKPKRILGTDRGSYTKPIPYLYDKL